MDTVIRKNITVRLTGNSEQVLIEMIERTGYSVNRLMNELIQNARIEVAEIEQPTSEIKICDLPLEGSE